MVKNTELFEGEFGKLFLENFPVKLVDNGFLWAHLNDKTGFYDITYLLFDKN